MVVAVLIVDFLVQSSTNLKDKRRVLSGLLDRTRARFNVSVAEVAYQNDHKRAQVAVACVGCTAKVVQGVLDSVTRLYDSHAEAEVIARTLEYL
ncbi:MAG: DUF503 domain-containing protein [Limnochordia bacterium]